MSKEATSSKAKDAGIILTMNGGIDNLGFYSKFDDTHGKDSRKNWYNNATEAYVEARPRYPENFVRRAMKEAKLEAGKHHILEVGCGPGTATVSLGELGYKVTAMDPSPQNCVAAVKQCQGMDVKVLESTFEDYAHSEEEDPPIDAIVCPTSFHWIQPDVACQKSAALLKRTQGCLLLWWAMPPMPASHSICEALQDIYDDLDESQLGTEIQKYATVEFNRPNLDKVREQINESGYYLRNDNPLVLQKSICYYTPEKFVLLLSTLSPYIALPEEKRSVLFQRVTERFKSLCQEANEPELELTNFYGSQICLVKE